MKPKKIAIYSGEVPSTTFINRLVELLAINGNVVYLFGKQTGKFFPSKNIILCTYSNRWNKLALFIKYSLLLFFFKRKDKNKLDEIIRNQFQNKLNYKVKFYPILYYKPDIFHLQWSKTVDEWIWVKEFGIKLVLSLRGTHITISPIADADLSTSYHKYFPLVDAFHAVSNSVKQEAIKYGLIQDKIRVIYSGLDCVNLPFYDKYKNDSKLNIISIGRAHWVKGYNYAIDACKILKDKNVSFNYKIIGIGNDEELTYQKQQLHLQDEVVFKNLLSYDLILEEIKNADILLLSSIEEGIANVVIEAMTLGTIVVSTNCGGMNEVINDSENGFLVPIRNPIEIANKIIFFTKMSNLEKELMAKKARKMIEMQHKDQQMLTEFEALYSNLLDS